MRLNVFYKSAPGETANVKHVFKLSMYYKNLTSFFSLNSSKMSSLLVAAIDFGTTFSGYAFSFLHDYKRDPLKISTNSWTAGVGQLMTLKTSTCVLFDAAGKFHSFGFGAEEKYSNLALDDNHHDWYYFRRFKMMLYDKKVQVQY